MKINDKKYVCDWDGTEINQSVRVAQAQNKIGSRVGGRHNMPDQLICPKKGCGRYVSQKTKFELSLK